MIDPVSRRHLFKTLITTPMLINATMLVLLGVFIIILGDNMSGIAATVERVTRIPKEIIGIGLIVGGIVSAAGLFVPRWTKAINHVSLTIYGLYIALIWVSYLTGGIQVSWAGPVAYTFLLIFDVLYTRLWEVVYND